MTQMDETDYSDMVEQSPVGTYVIEYREPAERGGELVGACITDQQVDGLSMIYSFFAADREDRQGLGNLIIMDHIIRARNAGLPYVYMGYWVKGSDRMAYKTRYRPMEVLGPNGWSRMADEDAVVPAPMPVRELV
jgi:arginine-tRNA-protein transferase